MWEALRSPLKDSSHRIFDYLFINTRKKVACLQYKELQVFRPQYKPAANIVSNLMTSAGCLDVCKLSVFLMVF